MSSDARLSAISKILTQGVIRVLESKKQPKEEPLESRNLRGLNTVAHRDYQQLYGEIQKNDCI